MIDTKSFEINLDFFSAKFIDDILWVFFQKNLLIQATNLSNRDALLSYLDRISACDAIKVIVFRSFLEESGHNEYIQFFKSIKTRQNTINLHRLLNVYTSLIQKISEMNKIVVHVTSGNVIPLFLNTSLACDYRIAADNTIFQNSHLEMGVLPIGGGAYFLSRLMGEGKALELLALRKAYTASEALEYGIIDQILPLKDLESGTLEFARKFEDVAGPTLSGLKKLISFSSMDLKKYLEFEHEEFFKTIHLQSFTNPSK